MFSEENPSCSCLCLVLVLVRVILLNDNVGSLFQAMSYSMWALIIWRSFTGLFAGSLILVQAYLSFSLFIIALLLILFPQKIAASFCRDWMLA